MQINEEKLKKVRKKIREFEETSKGDNLIWFLELCFCIVASNCPSKKAQSICNAIADGLISLDRKDLEEKLRKLGHPSAYSTSKRIVKARSFLAIKDMLRGLPDKKAREWLVRKIPSLSRVDASRFLRNLGYKQIVVLDKELLKILKELKIIERIPKKLTRRLYQDYEKKVENLAENLGLQPSELDLYLRLHKKGKLQK